MVVPATRNCLRLAGDTTNLDKLESYLEKYERLKELAATCPSGSCSLIRKLEGEGPKYFAELRASSKRLSANRRAVVSIVNDATFRKCSKIGRQKRQLKLPGRYRADSRC